MQEDMEMDLKLGKHLYEHKGIIFDALVMPKNRVQAVLNFNDVRADDVIVCSYPKAGTHWVMNLALKIAHDGDLEKAALFDIGDIAYEIEPPKNVDFLNMGARKLLAPTLEELSELPSPRIISSHLLFDMLPQKLQEGQAKIIYVLRDPRDITVSAWHQVNELRKLYNNPVLSWDEFFETSMQGAIMGGWEKHFASYQNVRSRHHVLTMYYERMKEDLTGSVAAIAKFLGKELSDDKLEAIAKSSTFESAKAGNPNSAFVRKGVAGGWKAQFTVSQSDRFAAHMDRAITDLELDIPYCPHSPIKVDSALYAGKTFKYNGKLF